jgi:hypothetical protein
MVAVAAISTPTNTPYDVGETGRDIGVPPGTSNEWFRGAAWFVLMMRGQCHMIPFKLCQPREARDNLCHAVSAAAVSSSSPLPRNRY